MGNALLALNCFHKNINFTIKLEKNNIISFLDLLFKRKPGKIETAVQRKKKYTDFYLSSYLFAPKSWTWKALKK